MRAVHRSRALVVASALALGFPACASPPPAAPPVAPTTAAGSAPPPRLPASSVPAAASSAPVAPRPLDEDVKDDEPTAGDEGLVKLIRRARHVVVGRIASGKEQRVSTPNGPARQSHVVVEITAFLKGSVDEVHAPYRKSFALWNDAMPEGVHKHPAPGHEDPIPPLVASVGSSRVFFLNLPSSASEGWGEPGPPDFIVRRWGKFSVGLAGTTATDKKDDVVRAIADEAKHAEWVKANADRLDVRSELDRDTPEASAAAVAAFVTRDLRERGGLDARVVLGAPKEDRGVLRFEGEITGSAAATGRLFVRVSKDSSRVVSFHVEAPVVKEQSGEHARRSDDEIAADLRGRLGLRSRGGKPFTRVGHGTRGDGVHLFSVEVHAGWVFHGGSSNASREARVSATGRTGVVFDYTNGWAEKR